MNRIYKLQKAYLKVMNQAENNIPDRDKSMDWERVHMSSAGRLGYLMGEARGLDPELCACACIVHDYGRVVTGVHKGHAEAGYIPVQEFLKNTNLFTEKEIARLAIAVKNHSKKGEIGEPIEEIVKDADILDFHQYGFPCEREEQQKRLDKLLKKD